MKKKSRLEYELKEKKDKTKLYYIISFLIDIIIYIFISFKK